jgi:predicted AAA+ superfamily ATPase
MIIIHAMSALPRLLAPQVQKALRTSPVVVLGGSRQTGKSTLVRQGALGRGRRYLSLDDVDVLDRALRAPEALLRDAGRLTLARSCCWPSSAPSTTSARRAASSSPGRPTCC